MKPFKTLRRMSLFLLYFSLMAFLSVGHSQQDGRERGIMIEQDLPDMSNHQPLKQIGIEALVLKTDIGNSYNFGVSGVTSFGHEIGVDPFIGSWVSYQGRSFESMDDLMKVLENDPKIEVVASSTIVCEENSTSELLNKTIYQLDEKLIPNTLENAISTQQQSIQSGITVCLKPLIRNNKRIDLKIFLENTTPNRKARAFQEGALEENALIPLSTTRQVATNVSIPNGFFAVLAGIAFDEREKEDVLQVPCLGEISMCGGERHKRTREQRSIVLILKPTILDSSET